MIHSIHNWIAKHEIFGSYAFLFVTQGHIYKSHKVHHSNHICFYVSMVLSVHLWNQPKGRNHKESREKSKIQVLWNFASGLVINRHEKLSNGSVPKCNLWFTWGGTMGGGAKFSQSIISGTDSCFFFHFIVQKKQSTYLFVSQYSSSIFLHPVISLPHIPKVQR